MNYLKYVVVILEMGLGAGLLTSCELDQMNYGSKIRPFAPSKVFSDRRSSRLPVEDTVARGSMGRNRFVWNGTSFPFYLHRSDLERGRDQFEAHCSPCHGRTGEGNGMIVLRGFTKPPSFFEVRLKNLDVGHYYEVATYGYGAMPSYLDQVDAKDRWRISAYIRVLQLSRSAPFSSLSDDKKRVLQKGSPP